MSDDAPKVPGQDIQPQYVNFFRVVVDPVHVRLTFGDATIGMDGTMHSAVVMSVSYGRQLSDVLAKMIVESGLRQNEVSRP
jgi:ribulose 1,5-bisphosphate synthetase/thiazole synthase